jgi:hypothetical protein
MGLPHPLSRKQMCPPGTEGGGGVEGGIRACGGGGGGDPIPTKLIALCLLYDTVDFLVLKMVFWYFYMTIQSLKKSILPLTLQYTHFSLLTKITCTACNEWLTSQ